MSHKKIAQSSFRAHNLKQKGSVAGMGRLLRMLGVATLVYFLSWAILSQGGFNLAPKEISVISVLVATLFAAIATRRT